MGEEPENSQVLIISAPGAVGKSTLAEAIACDKQALLWDLATASEVGEASLEGMLFNTLASGMVEDFREYMAEGLQFLIIDALDEGRIKVNARSFQRLFDNISKQAQGSRGVCFVLLGRTQIAEDAWLELSESGVATRLLEIEPFSREQASQYIENRLSENQRTHPYRECRDLIFRILEKDATTPEFVHYPPVLDAVATLLKAESNPLTIKTTLDSQNYAAQSQSISLLQTVIGRILTREQEEKLLPAIKESIGNRAREIGWADWHLLYSADEQCKRLLGATVGVSLPSMPLGLPEDIRGAYEDSVAVSFDQHPFWRTPGKFANHVFQCYLQARALLGEFGDELRDAVVEELHKQDILPTRLLAEFYLKGGQAKGDHLRTIAHGHLGILYESLISADSTKSHVRLNVDGKDPLDEEEGVIDDIAEAIEGEFEILTRTPDGDFETEHAIPFALEMSSSLEILFRRDLRNAIITAPCTVVLGGNTHGFQIGPSVRVSASTIRVEADSLIVGKKDILRPEEQDDDAVILEALVGESALTSRPTVYGGGKFSVNWPGADQHPWTEFRGTRSETDIDDGTSLSRVYKRFRRIAREFRSHKRNALARRRVKIENQRIRRGDLEHRLIQQLRTDGILELRDNGQLYFWVPSNADPLLGVSWQDLKNGEIPNSLKDYLGRFVQSNTDLFSDG